MMQEKDAHLLEFTESPHRPNIERSKAEYFSKKTEKQKSPANTTRTNEYR